MRRRRPRMLIGPLALITAAFAGCSRDAARPHDQPPSARSDSSDLRFHHVHLQVPDPAEVMAHHARASGCEKLILPGVGVGVRCADVYLLFDRPDLPSAPRPLKSAVSLGGRNPDVRMAVRVLVDDPATAQAWLTRHVGAAATQIALTGAEHATSLTDELTHLAFAAPDPDAAVTRLQAAGARIVSRRDDGVLLDVPGGLRVEVVRDVPAGPDAFWCPMHPDVRSPGGGSCPICGMPLVAIPSTTFGDFQMALDFDAAGPARGRMTIAIRDPEGTTRARAYHAIHERLLHFFLISRRLDVFAHLHPEPQPDGTFTLDVELPQPDAYLAIADFYPAGGTPQMLQTWWMTPDYRGDPFPHPEDVTPAGPLSVAGNIRVRLTTGDLAAGREQALELVLTDARTGRPIDDLQPYLGAAGHLLIVSADLADVVHSHPADTSSTGPTVVFDATFPRPGRYKLWAQFQRDDEVHTVAFVVDVR